MYKKNGSKKYFEFVNNIVYVRTYVYIINGFTKAKHNAVVSKCDDDLLHWFYTKKCFQFRPKLFPSRQVGKAFVRTKGHELVDAFLKLDTVSIACQSYVATLEQHNAREKTMLFLDPPYLDSCNLTYCNVTNELGDGTAFYRDIKKLVESNCGAVVLCVLNDNALLSLVFENHIKHKYAVTYGNTGKKTHHVVIQTNAPTGYTRLRCGEIIDTINFTHRKVRLNGQNASAVLPLPRETRRTGLRTEAMCTVASRSGTTERNPACE